MLGMTSIWTNELGISILYPVQELHSREMDPRGNLGCRSGELDLLRAYGERMLIYWAWIQNLILNLRHWWMVYRWFK